MSFAVTNDAQRIAYECIGTGRPTVLLHGFSDSRHSWREAGFVEPLLGAGRQLILVDCRGHGDSDKPHEPAAYASRHRAGDAIAVLDALGLQKADLIGYSMGGALALGTALFHPHRIGRLVVIAAHPFAQDMTPFRQAISGGIEHWLGLLEANGLRLSPNVRQRIASNDLHALRASVVEDRPDSSSLLPRLQTPLLAIAGSLDPNRESVRHFAELARGEFRSIEGCNHFSVFTASNRTVPAILEFFNRDPV
jgi:pimeloyl-ACP methyl ester carboxylesterase